MRSPPILIKPATNILAVHAKRVTLMSKDFHTLRQIVRIFPQPQTSCLERHTTEEAAVHSEAQKLIDAAARAREPAIAA